MGSTTSSRLPTFTSSEVKAIINRFQSTEGRQWGIDVFPCPIDLFEFIADITMMFKLQPLGREASYEVLSSATLLGRRIEKWKAPSQQSARKSHVVEAWRSGIILYLARLFKIPHGLFDVRSLTSNVFEHARAVPTASSFSYSMSWPLYQAGLELRDDDSEEKQWIRDRLRQVLLAVGCRQFGKTLRALEFVWSSGEAEHYNSITAGILKDRLTLG